MSQSPAPTGSMSLPSAVNNQGGLSALQSETIKTEPAATHPAPQQQGPQPTAHRPLQPAPPPHAQLPADRPNSSHELEQSRYSGPMNTSYPSPSAMISPLPNVPPAPMQPANTSTGPMGLPSTHPQLSQHLMQSVVLDSTKPPESEPAPKAYPCSTCGKAFARRSDLARHERIHSGVRPHVCDWQGCGKQFIQRSALTVHHRVHTGEKPHLCERCGKPFSDSSSLARHRRIHSGKRPYKCPFADCQKTFTRRTTLTRHQNHHTGTLEDAAKATAEALARGASLAAQQARVRPNLEGEADSAQDSPMSTPSPSNGNLSISPGAEMVGTNNLGYTSNNSLPAHLRGDGHAGNPTAPTTSSGYNSGMRPTSHPTRFGAPQTSEPNVESQQGPGSADGSPNMGTVDWQSPRLAASPAHSTSGNAYVYPDPESYPATSASMGQVFYQQAANTRRTDSEDPAPNSTYDAAKTRELWAGAQ